MLDYSQGNQQDITQTRLDNFPDMDNYVSNESFAQNRSDNFM